MARERPMTEERGSGCDQWVTVTKQAGRLERTMEAEHVRAE